MSFLRGKMGIGRNARGIGHGVPCHRVVLRSGDPGGYRCGVERKRALLEREAKGEGGSGSLRGGGASFFGLEPSAMTCSKLSTRDVGISLSMAPCVLANVGRSFPKEPPRAIS